MRRQVCRAVIGVVAILLWFSVPTRAWSAAAQAAPINLNTATEKQLEDLPGVGPATAKKIIAGRPYSSVSDLSKAGVPKATIEKITPLVTAGAAPAAASAATAGTSASGAVHKEKAATAGGGAKTPTGTVDLNKASQADLEALPGVGPATAKKIIAGRPYSAVADLSKAGVPKATIDKISSMVMVSGGAMASMPTPPPPAPPASTPPPVAKASTPATTAASTTVAQTPPSPGMVWANVDTKVYHKAGDRYYGKTKHGQWMTEQQAIAAGYRAAKTEEKKGTD
jgi:competence protein ComEA